MSRLNLDFSLSHHRRRYGVVVISLLLLCAFVFFGEKILVNNLEQNWTSIKTEKEQLLIQKVQSSFQQFQSESVEAVKQIAQHSTIVTSLSNRSTSTRILFEQIGILAPTEQTMELFDSSKRLLCWNGNEGIQTDTLWLNSQPTSFVVQGPIYSFLVVVYPVLHNSTLIGYGVSKRLFDVNYPINNRFINAEVFSSTFTSRLGREVQFDFSSPSKFSEELIPVSLSGIDGTQICTVLLPSLNLDEQEESVNTIARNIVHALILCLFLTIWMGVRSLHWLKQRNSIGLFWWLSTIWILRYFFIWLDIPSSFFQMKIFEPTYFASVFGFGIAKSVGDLFLTSIALLGTIILLVNSLVKRNLAAEKSKLNSLAAWSSIFIFSLTLPLLLRGFAAIIRSAVFDSTLSYYDPMYILPQFPLGVMLLSLFLISFALIMAGVAGISATRLALQRMFYLTSPLRLWVIVTGIFIAGNVLFEILHPNPLFSLTERFGYLALFFFGAMNTSSSFLQKNIFFHLKSTLVLSVLSILALLYPLDQQTHEFDRSHAEEHALNIIRPADTYLKILTRQALQELSNSEIINSFRETEPNVLKKLAFKAWARSILSREGYNCSVTFYKNEGTILSTFYLGADWSSPNVHPDSLAYPKSVELVERYIGSHIVNVYEGYTPVRNKDGFLEGGVSVQISAGAQSLLGGETPEYFRNYSGNDFISHVRQFTFSEYANAKLAFSSSETFPLGNELPAQVKNQTQHQTNFWIDEQINNQTYETYFFRPIDSPNDNSWYSLSMKKLDAGWHLFNVLRIVLFYSCCLFVLFLVYVFVSFVRGNRSLFSFRTKLIVTFFVVALIPTAILAYYNRQYAVERAEQSIIEQLKRETITITSALQRQWAIFTPFDLETFNDRHAITVANDVQIDFTVFADAYESASSKPELFRAELFDRRMNSDVYSNIILQQKGFYTNVQSIGTLQYIVGYRPLLTEAGLTFGIVAVPTLFRLQEIDEEIVQRNAFLFGAFMFAMLVALVVGFVSSHQISSPLHRLLQATKKIGAGDFDVQIRSNRTDEFGELEQSFETMLHNLKQSQEEIIKAQRELAWKEMAKQVAHEIKNPLTPMKLSIQHLRQAYIDRVGDFDKLLQQVSGTILEQIETLSRIASEFSHFGRMPERKIGQCELHALLLDVTNLYKEHTGVVFDLQFCPNSPIISADKEELRRAFMNIIKNSIQAMNERGTIAVRTHIANLMADIRFHDTGPGIAEAAREHLFEPNFSTKTDGMGLGLAIVKKTIDDLGGTIVVESETGSGTTVTIQLPLIHHQPERKND
ncbi:MAG: HAMP domain-containing protein [Ignavibacteriae bacterium]|nr:HAMP domain-containing protein [Ignavibacteriota bacterium]